MPSNRLIIFAMMTRVVNYVFEWRWAPEADGNEEDKWRYSSDLPCVLDYGKCQISPLLLPQLMLLASGHWHLPTQSFPKTIIVREFGEKYQQLGRPRDDTLQALSSVASIISRRRGKIAKLSAFTHPTTWKSYHDEGCKYKVRAGVD